MRRFYGLCIFMTVLLAAACTPGGWQDASPAAEAPALYPDYTDIVIPGNIAPLNFNVLNPADACVAVLSGADGEIVTGGRFALISLCIGGGMGVATIIERV